MRTNIVIKEALMKKAMRASRLKSKKATVEAGLELLISMDQQKAIRKWRGKLPWSGDLNAMRRD
jgi:Uncharacterized protein conserved in bacteria (DUF2191).